MVKEKKTDICILGAGPGGITAAMFLAKKGIGSLVVDKAVFPRDKVCGDALSGKVVDVIKKLDSSIIERLNPAPIQVGSWGVTFVSPDFKKLKVPFSNNHTRHTPPPGYISRRIDFDRFLINEAKKYSEIEICENVELNDFHYHAGQWICNSKDGNVSITTKLLIAADGAQSKFARHYAGMKMEPEHYCAGIRAYYSGVAELEEDNFIELLFLKELLPGYLWIFPLPGGKANVGIGMRSDVISRKKMNLPDTMQELIRKYPSLRRRFSNSTMEGGVKGFGLPLGSKKRSISGANYMLVGDAASLIDPFTGEGIGNAMISGMYAAQQAERSFGNNKFSAEWMRHYDQAVYGRLWSELALSRKMQRLVNVPGLFNFIVRKASSNKTLQDTISCMFVDLDIRKKLKQPSFYLNLLFS